MIKKGLKVKILTGKDKLKEGEVIEIDRASNRAKVKELNMIKKHVKTIWRHAAFAPRKMVQFGQS